MASLPADSAPTGETAPVEQPAVPAAPESAADAPPPPPPAPATGEAPTAEPTDAGQDASEQQDDAADGPPKKRSRFGDAAPEADASPEDPLARARAIAERLTSAIPGKDGEKEVKSLSVQVRKKVYLPADAASGKVDYIGLLLGPEGQNQKDMEKQSGAKVSRKPSDCCCYICRCRWCHYLAYSRI
jgi:hypothetical protein